eukprot:TRINITY_DN13566_c0_g1_i1.p1 TRINITY_DN13566_c0_g1~~TRINITY_DN13566_c0_g1_i1.p1  ORF type:complete len:1022 (-),score=243.53 TRINITY_DN13566_c0_g1_i1:287-2941(-)
MSEGLKKMTARAVGLEEDLREEATRRRKDAKQFTEAARLLRDSEDQSKRNARVVATELRDEVAAVTRRNEWLIAEVNQEQDSAARARCEFQEEDVMRTGALRTEITDLASQNETLREAAEEDVMLAGALRTEITDLASQNEALREEDSHCVGTFRAEIFELGERSAATSKDDMRRLDALRLELAELEQQNAVLEDSSYESSVFRAELELFTEKNAELRQAAEADAEEIAKLKAHGADVEDRLIDVQDEASTLRRESVLFRLEKERREGDVSQSQILSQQLQRQKQQLRNSQELTEELHAECRQLVRDHASATMTLASGSGNRGGQPANAAAAAAAATAAAGLGPMQALQEVRRCLSASAEDGTRLRLHGNDEGLAVERLRGEVSSLKESCTELAEELSTASASNVVLARNPKIADVEAEQVSLRIAFERAQRRANTAENFAELFQRKVEIEGEMHDGMASEARRLREELQESRCQWVPHFEELRSELREAELGLREEVETLRCRAAAADRRNRRLCESLRQTTQAATGLASPQPQKDRWQRGSAGPGSTDGSSTGGGSGGCANCPVTADNGPNGSAGCCGGCRVGGARALGRNTVDFNDGRVEALAAPGGVAALAAAAASAAVLAPSSFSVAAAAAASAVAGPSGGASSPAVGSMARRLSSRMPLSLQGDHDRFVNDNRRSTVDQSQLRARASPFGSSVGGCVGGFSGSGGTTAGAQPAAIVPFGGSAVNPCTILPGGATLAKTDSGQNNLEEEQSEQGEWFDTNAGSQFDDVSEGGPSRGLGPGGGRRASSSLSESGFSARSLNQQVTHQLQQQDEGTAALPLMPPSVAPPAPWDDEDPPSSARSSAFGLGCGGGCFGGGPAAAAAAAVASWRARELSRRPQG